MDGVWCGSAISSPGSSPTSYVCFVACSPMLNRMLTRMCCSMHSRTASPRANQTIERNASLPRLLAGRYLCVAANRGPVHYHLEADRLRSARAAGGLVTALTDIAGYAPMTWVATASGPGDRLVAGHPPPGVAAPGVPRLRFVVASEESLNWFYRRFANPILWFLQHGMWDLIRRPDIVDMMEKGWMLGYRPVNEAFARVIEQEVRGEPRPVILTHDYHLYLLPRLLRKRVPAALLQHFTHIPWPGPRVWELSLIHISEPTRLGMISYAVFCLKKK